jgi:hypothetical protein
MGARKQGVLNHLELEFVFASRDEEQREQRKENSSGSASWKLHSSWLFLKSSALKKAFAPTAACAFLPSASA